MIESRKGMKDKILQSGIFSNKRLCFAVMGACLALTYLGGMMVMEEKDTQRRYVESDIINFKNFSDASNLEITLKNKSGIFDLTFKEQSIVLPPNVVKNFSLPYVVTAKWQEKDQYKTILWSLDQRGVAYNIVLDGFSTKDNVSLSINKSYPFKKLPFDWSGKIELPSLLPPDKNMDICIEIETNNSFSVCHRVIGKQERAST